MRNSFNFLLIALICMDSSYLIGWIIEAFRKSFQVRRREREGRASLWQKVSNGQGWGKAALFGTTGSF